MKKKLLLLVFPIIMLYLLTGCGDYLIECESHGLPEGARAYILTKNPEYTYIPPKNTELENYNEDGWHYYSDAIVVGRRKDEIKNNPVIRIAVLDKDGKILKISPEFELRIKGKCYFWNSFSYNYDTNEVTGKRTDYYGNDFDDFLFSLFIGFLDVLCFIIYMVAVCRMNEKNYKDYYLYLFLNIPNLIIIIMGGLWTFCSYFQAPDEPPNFERNINGYLFFIGFVCLVNSLGVIRYRRLKKAAAENERER